MSDAAVAEAIGNFAEVEFVVEQELFYFFDFLANDVLLECDAFDAGEKCAEVIVVVVQFVGENFGPVETFVDFFVAVNFLDDGVFDGFDESCFAVVDSFEAEVPEACVEACELGVAEGFFFQLHFAEHDIFGVEVLGFELPGYRLDAAVADHVLNVEYHAWMSL